MHLVELAGAQQMKPTDNHSEHSSEEQAAFDEVYRRLKAMASRQRKWAGFPKTLCTTELVHEAYLRMGSVHEYHQREATFFAYAARAMRHILVDAARRRVQPKRGGDQARVDLDDAGGNLVHVDPRQALELDDALRSLERHDVRAARVVELHYFAGLDLNQVAELLGVARRTIDRDWNYARVYLASQRS